MIGSVKEKNQNLILETGILHIRPVHVAVDLQQPSGAGVRLCPTEATRWEQRGTLANPTRTWRNPFSAGDWPDVISFDSDTDCRGKYV